MIDIDTFARIAEAEYARLPEEFRALTGELVIQVADLPAPEILDDMGLESAYDLLGLFEGVGLAQAGAFGETGMLPNRIWLYRRPILAFHAEGSDPLEAVIRHVLIHEIGHHFGLSDEDMYAIDDAEDEDGDKTACPR
jgi:predicted Zn-dependent protease with MMP-like domain